MFKGSRILVQLALYQRELMKEISKPVDGHNASTHWYSKGRRKAFIEVMERLDEIIDSNLGGIENGEKSAEVDIPSSE